MDNVDVERFLTLSNSAPAKEPQQEIVPISYTVSDEELMIMFRLLIWETLLLKSAT